MVLSVYDFSIFVRWLPFLCVSRGDWVLGGGGGGGGGGGEATSLHKWQKKN